MFERLTLLGSTLIFSDLFLFWRQVNCLRIDTGSFPTEFSFFHPFIYSFIHSSIRSSIDPSIPTPTHISYFLLNLIPSLFRGFVPAVHKFFSVKCFQFGLYPFLNHLFSRLMLILDVVSSVWCFFGCPGYIDWFASSPQHMSESMAVQNAHHIQQSYALLSIFPSLSIFRNRSFSGLTYW